jgi:hypothetical protein
MLRCGRSSVHKGNMASGKGQGTGTHRKARGFNPAACWTFRVSWPWRRCKRLNVASSTGTRPVNEPSGCPADRQAIRLRFAQSRQWTLPYRISVWLGARPCPRLSSDVRSSRRNDNPIGHGIPFDTVAFVLCSTRDLSEENEKLREGCMMGR